MSLRSNLTGCTTTHLNSPLTPPPPRLNLSILRHPLASSSQFRVWRRRRRLKTNRRSILVLRCLSSSSSPFETLMHSLVSQFPSVNSLDLIAPALGFASGLALFLTRFTSDTTSNSQKASLGGGDCECMLFTSPTAFNRFVVLRCPSISFQERNDQFLDLNDKLMKEDTHYVRIRLSSDTTTSTTTTTTTTDDDDDDLEEEKKLVYQRVCVNTDDGGVISLDWPAQLDLSDERGLDTTLLLIPGTAQGSMDTNIRSLVCESLKQGFFPIVINPRGCAGSPLTTPRLFTAADSDDICTAINFVNKERSWTTLMAVGWGYGANILTKYLGEVGERTPLTAATCIDNPFDLEEATRSSHHYIDVDQKLTGGLINILQSNKELFGGRAKGFNVEKALLSKSIQDFDEAISMISYGYDALRDFYAACSTRDLVTNVKIPVLFIQTNDETLPLLSIPRGLIAENPFTSLLVCCFSPSQIVETRRSSAYQFHHLSVEIKVVLDKCAQSKVEEPGGTEEWLMAVELGLLKGRHPLLMDVDVTVNPSKGLAVTEGRESVERGRVKKLLNVSPTNAANGYSVQPPKDVKENWISVNDGSKTGEDPHRNSLVEDITVEETGPVDVELAEQGVTDEKGQVLQTTGVVMKILDVTMPGTLTEEQKKKALTAVGQGETVMKALQDAVPDDVREKLTTAVSGILNNKGATDKLGQLVNISSISDVASGITSKIQEKEGGLPSSGVGKNPRSSDQRHQIDKLPNDKQVTEGKPTGEPETELHAQKPIDDGQLESTTSGIENSSSSRNDPAESEKNPEKADASTERAAQLPDHTEGVSDTGVKPDPPVLSEKTSDTKNITAENLKADHGSELPKPDMKVADDIHQDVESATDSSSDQNEVGANKDEVLTNPSSSSESQLTEREGSDNVEEENHSPSSLNQSNSNSPNFDVSQAFDALTGMDDSTQVAVNSVFGVIENMITQLEEEKDANGIVAVTEDNEDRETESGPDKVTESGPDKVDDRTKSRESPNSEPDMVDDCCMDDGKEGVVADTEDNEERETESGPDMVDDCCMDEGTESVVDDTEDNEDREVESGNHQFSSDCTKSRESPNSEPDMVDHCCMDDGRESVVSRETFPGQNNVENLINTPLYVTSSSYNDPLDKRYLQTHLLPKMQNSKALDLDRTTSLFLDYFPEEGRWKLLEPVGGNKVSVGDIATDKSLSGAVGGHSPLKPDKVEFIEPPYVVMDAEKPKELQEYDTIEEANATVVNNGAEELRNFVKNIIIDTLKFETHRKLGDGNSQDMEPILSVDIEQVANTVIEGLSILDGKRCNSNKLGTLKGEQVIRAISLALPQTDYLRRVLPVGVVVGTSLAALRRFFDVASVNGINQSQVMALNQINGSLERNHVQLAKEKTDVVQWDKIDRNRSVQLVKEKTDVVQLAKEETDVVQLVKEKTDVVQAEKNDQNRSVSESRSEGETESEQLRNNTVMAGCVTAALGASALLVNQQDSAMSNENFETSLKSSEEKKDLDKRDEISGKNQNNVVASLAEKAMSVASPVVPMNDDGEVDQERLVAMLAEWGQRGGVLRLVGKAALLWGGMRGAMSLTYRLISFLHISERPLLQRMMGFVCMVLVLWSPVVVPLLPTVVQGWASHNSSTFAELICVIGLYASTMLLVMLWGKRIRRYENPFLQYGLDFVSLPKIQNLLKGLVGGIVLVLLIHSLNVLLGCVELSWPSTFVPYSPDAMSWLKVYTRIFLLVSRGIITATGIAVVEELLFRSWLPDEIAVDFGHHRAIIFSGLTFSIFQRYPLAIPGLWFLSLSLAGARQKSQGSLSVPIGLRAGIMASSYVLQTGGFLTYRPNFPLWVTGTHPFQPFSGVAGFTLSLLLAIVLYPRRPPNHRKLKMKN